MNHDSVTAALFRLVKRRWYVFAAVVALAAVAAGVLASNSTYTAEQNIQIGELDDIGAVLGSAVPDVELVRLAQRAQLDVDSSELPPGIGATFSANSAARAVTIVVTGPSEEAVNESLVALNLRFTELTTEPLLAQIDVGIGLADRQLDALEESAASSRDQLAAAEGDPTATAVLIAEQSSLRLQIAQTTEHRNALGELRAYVADGLVSSGSSSVTAPAAGVMVYAAGVVAGVVLALIGGLAWVLLDRRIRRVIHLERAAPGVPVLAVVGDADAAEPGAGVAGLAGVVAAVAGPSGPDRVVLFGIGRSGDLSPLAGTIGRQVAVPVVSTAAVASALASGPIGDAGFVGVVRWGSTTEDQVSTAVGDLARAGARTLGLVLLDVPAHDRDWVASTAAAHLFEPGG